MPVKYCRRIVGFTNFWTPTQNSILYIEEFIYSSMYWVDTFKHIKDEHQPSVYPCIYISELGLVDYLNEINDIFKLFVIA